MTQSEENKSYVMPMEDFKDIVEPYLDELKEIMVDECMLLEDVVNNYHRDSPLSTTDLMDYACEYYSQCLYGDIDSNSLPEYQDKLDKTVHVIREAVDILTEKLDPYLSKIEQAHPGKENWNVYRTMNNLICIGVGTGIGVNDSKAYFANRPIRPPKRRSFIHI